MEPKIVEVVKPKTAETMGLKIVETYTKTTRTFAVSGVDSASGARQAIAKHIPAGDPHQWNDVLKALPDPIVLEQIGPDSWTVAVGYVYETCNEV